MAASHLHGDTQEVSGLRMVMLRAEGKRKSLCGADIYPQLLKDSQQSAFRCLAVSMLLYSAVNFPIVGLTKICCG
ncbi:hypothetical protein MHYP_G00052720 [Metynnis hypsauchen]